MGNTGNNGEDNARLYATAVEVDGLRRLTEFMKDQEAQNKSINSSLEKLLKLAEDSGAKLQDPLPEDKGSNTKGKNANASYQIPRHRRQEYYRGDPSVHKKVNFAPSSSTMTHKPSTPHPSQYQAGSQDGQFEEDEYTEYGETPYFDLEQDWNEHPWNIHTEEEPYPKQPQIPLPNSHNTNYQTQNKPSYTHNHHTFTNQTHISHRQQTLRDKQQQPPLQH
jgi:hypothetical protein